MPNFQVGEKYTSEELENIGLHDVVAVKHSKTEIVQVASLVADGTWYPYLDRIHKVTVGESVDGDDDGVPEFPLDIQEPVEPNFRADLNEGVEFLFFSDASMTMVNHQESTSIYTEMLSEEQFDKFLNYVNYLGLQRKGLI